MQTTVKTLIAILLQAIAISGYAQRPTDTQQTGAYAPDNIKIDGRGSEWDNKLQRYSRGNRCFYTICNDDSNLYVLTIMDGIQANEKVLQGGISIILKPFEPNKTLKDITITYPAISNRKKTQVIINNSNSYSKLKNDTIGNENKIRELVATTNKDFNSLFTTIGVDGIETITIPQIKINNDAGIKAIAQFSGQMIYTFELAIPLKYLKTVISPTDKIKYNIRLNGVPGLGSDNPNTFPAPGTVANLTKDDLYINYPSFVSGIYVLAKKSQ